MRTEPNYLFRVVVVKLVDKLFYEPGNAQRCHSQANALITRQLCGIGNETYWDYLDYPDEVLSSHALRPEIEYTLRLLVTLVKSMPAYEAACFLEFLYRRVDTVLRDAKREESYLNSETLIARLSRMRCVRIVTLMPENRSVFFGYSA
jgi:hypothetical protein